jgi:hypothetical protein
MGMSTHAMKTPPWRKWFKLVGVTGGRVPANWIDDEPSLRELMRFPKHRQPTNMSNYEGLIAYWVGEQKVFAAQRRAGSIRINDPSGPKGSVTHRWPHEMEVETFAWVAELRDAPLVSDVLPEFMEKYRKNFWNGSHWQITDDEFEALQAAIISAGEGVPVPPPPFGK